MATPSPRSRSPRPRFPRLGRAHLALAAALAAVALAALQVRVASQLRVAAAPADGGEAAWFSIDPDSLFHMRRLDRALADGGSVAARDPLLDFPRHTESGGAPIPWPATYTRVLYALSAPFAPSDPGARALYVEHAVSLWPMLFATLTALVVAWSAAASARGAATGSGVGSGAGATAALVAALVAGLYYATVLGSVRYSYWGIGDHHAWVSLLTAAWFAVAGSSLERDRPSALAGGGSGLLAGAALGSWVASIAFVVLFQAALLALALRRARGGRPSLTPFALAFHGAALVVLLPEILVSPWPALDVVNLSWFHFLVLTLGALALAWVPVASRHGARRVVFGIAGFALGVAVIVAATPLRGTLGEAFRWAGGSNDFMRYINESQPLFAGPAGGLDVTLRWLGAGVLVLPFAWWSALRTEREALVPWAVAAPALLVAALLQRRFSESFVPVLSVLVGAWAGRLVLAPRAARIPRYAWLAIAIIAPLAANQARTRIAWQRTFDGARFVESTRAGEERARRELCRSLAESGGDEEAVLAQWDLGHMIEWVARRPTVATNFGSYLGRESYLDPWRFLATSDEREAERILIERRATHVLLCSDWARNAATIELVLGKPLSRDAMVERLLPRGTRRDRSLEDVGFLRRVASATMRVGERDIGPAGWVYERVAGAWIDADGPPGTPVAIEVSEGLANSPRVVIWRRSDVVGPKGSVRLRVPYSTCPNDGHGGLVREVSWYLGDHDGRVVISERDVLEGQTVVLP